MSNVTFEIKAKSKTGKGIVGKDKVWYNTGKGVSFSDVDKGDVVTVEYLESEGVRFVSKITKTPPIPEVPSLPKTTVTETKATGGELPVKPAKKIESEVMTKADWNVKDRNIELIAVVKSVLESGAYAQLSIGKREEDVFQLGARMVDFYLGLVNRSRQ